MTLPNNVKQFTTENHMGVLTCFRKNGMPQMSVVTCGAYRDGVGFTTTAGRAKLLNLQRDARCSLMVSKVDWWGYVVLEGKATILSADNTPADELRDALREARGEERACVIVVETEKHRFLPDAGVWWDIATAEVSGDAITARLRAQYEEGRVRQRFHH